MNLTRLHSPAEAKKIRRIDLLAQNLQHIKLGQAADRCASRTMLRSSEKAVLTGHRNGTAFISTSLDGSQAIVSVH